MTKQKYVKMKVKSILNIFLISLKHDLTPTQCQFQMPQSIPVNPPIQSNICMLQILKEFMSEPNDPWERTGVLDESQ